MPIRQFIAGKSFDPEMLVNLEVVFECVCADLAVARNASHSRETVAKKVIELAESQRDPEALRAAVIASLSTKH